MDSLPVDDDIKRMNNEDLEFKLLSLSTQLKLLEKTIGMDSGDRDRMKRLYSAYATEKGRRMRR